jgi:hypothetical protein
MSAMRNNGKAGGNVLWLRPSFAGVFSFFLWKIFTLNALQGMVIVLCLTKGKTGLKSSGVGASQRCGSGTPLKPHSLYRVFPL